LSTQKKITIILLAAGRSSRMGQNKLLVEVGGETLLENALRSATRSSADNVIIVTGANNEENEPIITRFPALTAYNADWEKGIGSSIKCGLKMAIKNHEDLDAVIISVCDQPFLFSDIFNRLIGRYLTSGKTVVASDYEGSLGVPVLYNKSMFEELMKIPDEYGAKKYILEKMDAEMIEKVPFTKGDIDVDTLEDLNQFES